MSELAQPEPEREPPEGARKVVSWIWALSPAWSLGFSTAPIMVYAGVRHRHVVNWALAAVYIVCSVLLMITAGSDEGTTADVIFNSALAFNIFVGTGHGLVIRSRVFSKPPKRQPRNALEAQRAALAGDEEQAELRRVAREIVETNQSRAVYLQIGRIDLPGREFPDGGLIDVNNVPYFALGQRVPVLEPYLDHLVEGRARIRGFASVEDLSVALDLPPHLLDHVADRLIFLPYYGAH